MTHSHWDPKLHPRDLNDGRFTDKWVSRLSAIAGSRTWETSSPRAARDEYETRLRDMISTMAPSMDRAAVDNTMRSLLGSGSIPIPRTVYRSGEHRVVIATDQWVPVERILREASRLHQANPTRDPINLWVVDGQHMVLPNAHAETIRGTAFIRMNADSLANEKGFRQHVENDPEFFMPTAEHTGAAEYFLAHEWGHAIDYDDVPGGDAKTQAHLKAQVNMSLSEYGSMGSSWGDVNEAYAEAFAEWWLSGGKTTNAAAIAYADMYQWKTR